MKTARRKTGDFGERIAEKYLSVHGHAILAKNFFVRWAEIDIITQKGDALHFFEIKTRRSLQYGMPIESISQHKLKKIEAAAYVFIKRNPQLHWQRLAIGIVAIIYNPVARTASIKCIENIAV